MRQLFYRIMTSLKVLFKSICFPLSMLITVDLIQHYNRSQLPGAFHAEFQLNDDLIRGKADLLKFMRADLVH